MLKTILCNKDNHFSEVKDPQDISELIADADHLVWLDLAAPTLEDFRLLRAEFGLHPLAIEDAMSRHQRPKVDQYENFYFVVFYAVHCQGARPPEQMPGRDTLAGSDNRRSPGRPAAPADPIHANLRPAAPGDGPGNQKAETHPTLIRRSYRRADQAAAAAAEEEDDRLVLREISMFMGSNWLITVHQEPIDELTEVEHRWERNVEAITGQDTVETNAPAPAVPKNSSEAAAPPPRLAPPAKKNGTTGKAPRAQTENDIGILLYSLLDTIVDNYFPTIDSLVDRIEALEEQIFERFTPEALQSIFGLKKDLLALRKVLAPERDVLNVLTRRELPIFNAHTLVYFQDVYDHVVRITDSIDTYRDLLSSALDSYLSLQSNRLNITVQTLTSASIILMALSVITGIYGTNFENIPELHFKYGYFAMLGVLIAIALGLYAFFKRKGWL